MEKKDYKVRYDTHTGPETALIEANGYAVDKNLLTFWIYQSPTGRPATAASPKKVIYRFNQWIFVSEVE